MEKYWKALPVEKKKRASFCIEPWQDSSVLIHVYLFPFLTWLLPCQPKCYTTCFAWPPSSLSITWLQCLSHDVPLPLYYYFLQRRCPWGLDPTGLIPWHTGAMGSMASHFKCSFSTSLFLWHGYPLGLDPTKLIPWQMGFCLLRKQKTLLPVLHLLNVPFRQLPT